MTAAPTSKRRAADVAYDAVESLIVTLQIAPGSAVVEAEIAQRTGLGRTPVREALLRMVSVGLVVQQPRRGLMVSAIDLGQHFDLLHTRRALESLIAASSARRATPAQRKALVRCAQSMQKAALRQRLDEYMQADHALDQVNHEASQNQSAIKAVVPLIVQCRRFWYAYQYEGEMDEGAAAHLALAEGIASGVESAAIGGANRLLDYLEKFAQRVINR